jgi:tetratricopeptide (TPR) repeat protein
MKNSILSIIACFLFLNVFAQTDKQQALAKQYFQTGDYEKAALLFEDLWKNESSNLYYYNSLFTCYIRLNQYEAAEKTVKKQQKKYKDDLSYPIDLGYIYSQNNQADAANATFKEVVNLLPADVNVIRNIAAKFLSIRQDDYAILSYLKGRELLKDKSMFSFELGNVYLQSNKAKEAVAIYLQIIGENPNLKNTVQNILTNNLQKDNIQEELESQLYTLLQKNIALNEYAEMLIWLFTHQNDYGQALIQAKALDKKNQEDGARVISLANNALQEKQYQAAIDGYNYVLTKGDKTKYYLSAKSQLMEAQKLLITTTPNYTQEDILTLKTNYTSFLNQYGKTMNQAATIRALADLEAYYLMNIPAAIQLLSDLIALPNLPKKTKNEAKLDLGDYYVLSGDVWEATLIYAQVDKDEKDSPLGEDARYRNARLSYYKGEFEWAQAQLSVLKGATTELIANNALELSIFILDNIGLDTVTTTMEFFADAELLHRQNKDNEALSYLDKILKEFPGHALTDDVLFKKANIYFENRKYTNAASLLEQILQNHREDILADNACFMLGDIYQNYLNNPEKAMEYYKTILTDFSDSVLMVEARKRFRFLRGDDV